MPCMPSLQRSCAAPTGACLRGCAPGSSRPAGRARDVGRAAGGRRRAGRAGRGPRIGPRRPEFTRARWPTRRSARTGSTAARRVRSCRRWRSCDLSVARPGSRPAGDRRGARGAGAPPSPRVPSSKQCRRPSPRPVVRPGSAAQDRARRPGPRLRGREPVLLRSGGTLPILASFADRRIPAIVSGFGLPEDNFHARRIVHPRRPGARRRAARALYEDLGAGLARGA